MLLEFDVGTPVKVLSGKYSGCIGTISKFSASSKKPNVCRDCDTTGSADQQCCGTTKRSKCWYYKFADIEKTDSSSTTDSSPVATGRDLSSFFQMQTLLKCAGSKRKGTWSCSTTMDATRPLTTTVDATSAVISSGSNGCPSQGQPGWQGAAPVLASTFKKSKALHGPLEYSFGTLWVDSNAKGVRRFSYTARQDCGRLDRHGSFKIDKTQRAIQQTTGKSYPKHCNSPRRNGLPWSLNGLNSKEIKDQCTSVLAYDRGHLIPANHFDDNKKTITETNFMINILPQADKMNRGAWLETEMIIECLRDVEALTVLGGAVYPPSSEKGKSGLCVIPLSLQYN